MPATAMPRLNLKSDLVHETVHTAMVAGKDLDALIAAGVMAQIGPDVTAGAGVTWKVSYRSETTSTEGTRQIAEVMIVVDHRHDRGSNANVD